MAGAFGNLAGSMRTKTCVQTQNWDDDRKNLQDL